MLSGKTLTTNLQNNHTFSLAKLNANRKKTRGKLFYLKNLYVILTLTVHQNDQNMLIPDGQCIKAYFPGI